MGQTFFEEMNFNGVSREIENFLTEDDLSNSFYLHSLPMDLVNCEIKIKSDLVLAGLPYFFSVFQKIAPSFVSPEMFQLFRDFEGKHLKSSTSLTHQDFKLPFAVALTGERIALNLLARASAVASHANKFSEVIKSSGKDIVLLDTRKTTPGLRSLEKYAVRVGGGHNHRFSQSDVWMIKDNHKQFFGGLTKAYEFFKSQGAFYRPIIAEVHSLDEFEEACKLGVQHIMLDNFLPDAIKSLAKKKPAQMTIEVSGGVRLDNIADYCVEGVDAISVGALTHSAPHVDISFKFKL